MVKTPRSTLTTSSVSAVTHSACSVAAPGPAAITPWAWSIARPSRRGMNSCSVAAMKVETMVIATCQG